VNFSGDLFVPIPYITLKGCVRVVNAKVILLEVVLIAGIGPGVRSPIAGERDPLRPFSLTIPRVDILVQQEGGAVRFEFFLEEELNGVKNKIHNDKITTVAVVKEGEEIWKIEASSRGVSTVTYGVVPSGFVQTIPKAKNVPLLEKNMKYYVRVDGWSWGGEYFVYLGRLGQ